MSLEFRNITLYLENRIILEDVSFSCSGRITAVMGTNGAGKTSLLKSLLGLYHPERGEILLDGINLGQLKSPVRRAQLLSYVPQDCQAAGCPVQEFVVMGRNPYLKFWQMPEKKEYEAVEHALEELGIQDLKNRTMEHLSGGERKLCYLARARVQEAGWMVLDEPESGQDFGRRRLLLSRLREYLTKHGKHAIMSVHDPALADAYADRVVLLQEGRILDCISQEDENYEERMMEGLRRLYGRQLDWVRGAAGRAVVWRGDRNADHSELCESRKPGAGL